MAKNMESITEISRACRSNFTQLSQALTQAGPAHRELMPPADIEQELGRFHIWCTNLGALQNGPSSLDSRLRESTVMRGNILRHLTRLNKTLIQSRDVVSGKRLPLEQMPKPEDFSSEENSSSSDESEDDEPPKELVLNMDTVKQTMSDLYMLSFRIRNSSSRPTSSLRMKIYREIDDETGIDKLAAYTEFDRRHIEDSLLQIRRDSAIEMNRKPSLVSQIRNEDKYLIDRLVATMNQRRKIIRYWQRHAKKIAYIPKEIEEIKAPIPIPTVQKEVLERPKVVEKPEKKVEFSVASKSEKTYLSKTEATRYDSRLDDIMETRSVISYASMAPDLQGNHVELPPPPPTASKGTEFLCPYCGIICPVSDGKDRAWRTHILKDLQPYVCTYPDCPDGDRLYNRRTVWLEHERLGHRRIWQCFEHVEPKFPSKDLLQHHLHSDHGDTLTDVQIQSLVDVSESSVADTRTRCPFCHLEGPFSKGFENHMAFHMQTFAAFSVSRDIVMPEDDHIDPEGHSGRAQGLGSHGSSGYSPLQFNSQPPSEGASARSFSVASSIPDDEDSDEEGNILTPPILTFGGPVSAMDELDQVLPDGASAASKRKIVVIHDHSSFVHQGRSLAADFARKKIREFTDILWFNCYTHTDLMQCFELMASRLPVMARVVDGTIPTYRGLEAINKCREYLSTPENHEWLLIFDYIGAAVDSTRPGMGISMHMSSVEEYFPKVDHGSIIIVTQHASHRKYGHIIDLDASEREKMISQLRATIQNVERTTVQDTDVLIDRLYDVDDNMVLSQVDCYIRETNTSASKYVELLGQTPHLLAHGVSLNNISKRIWYITYEQIQKQSEEAAGLLKLWSFFDYEDLWYGLTKTALYIQTDMGDIIPEWLLPIARDELKFAAAVDILSRYSLVRKNEDADSYTMQPGFHSWCLHLEESDKVDSLLCIALGIIAQHVPTDFGSDRQIQKRILPHAIRAVRFITRNARGKSHDEIPLPPWAFRKLGNLLFDEDQLSFAEEVYVQGVRRAEEIFGGLNQATLSACNNLGLLYLEQRQLDKAEAYLQRAYDGSLNKGAYTMSLDMMNNIGNLLTAQGRLDGAEEIYNMALREKEKTLGEKDIGTLTTVNNLGNLYAAKRLRSEAEKMYTRALRGKEEVLGKDHESTLITVNNLALLYTDWGRMYEADSLYKRALQAKEKTCGAIHSSTLITVSNLANLYRAQRRLVEAEAMYDRALKGKRMNLGENHPSTIITATNLKKLRKLQEVLGRRQVKNDTKRKSCWD